MRKRSSKFRLLMKKIKRIKKNAGKRVEGFGKVLKGE